MKISQLEKLEQMFRDFKEIVGFYRITSVAVLVVLLAVTSFLIQGKVHFRNSSTERNPYLRMDLPGEDYRDALLKGL